MSAYRIEDYVAEDGRVPFRDWLFKVPDIRVRVRVVTRLQRLAAGNFGDSKPLRDGVSELRIDHGPGYRIYYARAGEALVVLLAAGDKRKQRTDIEKAISYWNDWKRRAAS